MQMVCCLVAHAGSWARSSCLAVFGGTRAGCLGLAKVTKDWPRFGANPYTSPSTSQVPSTTPHADQGLEGARDRESQASYY